ncbi:hypothetical protein Poli38472_006878 [Pythium oligandrum]|uniref:WRKY19-like zinc finger domain-containing protein n=1 Tax=Pythium oligandrum TaxID=41045 RepID=A0A8K1C5M8_PYTOL|nr:hypothetical protein Poli38472_006878 [Pythium oligandrum]|eukprot:TMW56868.1 hypothetical protein Poli38472_006878 [Pythium oligandrum]
MFASGSLSLLHTGGSSSFTTSSLESYRSQPAFVSSSRWPSFPIIHLKSITTTIDAGHVLKGMGGSDDERMGETKSPMKISLPPLQHLTAHGRDGAHELRSPGSATATGIAAMSLSFIINEESENTPRNHQPAASLHHGHAHYGPNEGKSAHGPLAPKAAGASCSNTSFGVNAILNTVCAKSDCYRTIRGPSGSFCKYHKQSRFCRAEGCGKSAKTGGYCISHGGGKRCSFPQCTKSAKQGGLCISHGGGKRCNEEGCTKSALVGGFCSAHGGGRKCKTADCTKTALLGGFCIAHGGGKRCQVEGCSKSAVGGMLCVSHGGGKRCQAEGCNKGAVRNGVCIRHGAKRESGAASSSNASASGSPSPVRSIKAEYSP